MGTPRKNWNKFVMEGMNLLGVEEHVAPIQPYHRSSSFSFNICIFIYGKIQMLNENNDHHHPSNFNPGLSP